MLGPLEILYPLVAFLCDLDNAKYHYSRVIQRWEKIKPETHFKYKILFLILFNLKKDKGALCVLGSKNHYRFHLLYLLILLPFTRQFKSGDISQNLEWYFLMKKQGRKKHKEEFKKEAARLALESGKAKKVIFEHIEIYYNRKRKHSTIGYKTPTQYELLNT